MRVIGVDPGSKSFDVFGLDVEEQRICIDTSISTKRVMSNPEILIETIASQEPFDIVAAPSGLGIPIKKVQDLTDEDIFQMVLRNPKSPPTMGLQSVIKKIGNTDWNAVVIPGVKYLPTVASHRKINKIDMGTSDKLCAAVVGIKDLMETHNIPCTETNFIMVELGAAFSAILAIEGGKIIDGIGGSNILGFKACGSLDGEVAYLMGEITKKKIYSGGISSIIGYGAMGVEEIQLLAQNDPKSAMALNAFIDAIVKGVYSLWASYSPGTQLQNILLSGRLAKNDLIRQELEKRLNVVAPVRVMQSYANIAKRAAQGAAYIADGLMGGPSKAIIDNLELEKATGKVLDEIYLPLDL